MAPWYVAGFIKRTELKAELARYQEAGTNTLIIDTHRQRRDDVIRFDHPTILPRPVVSGSVKARPRPPRVVVGTATVDVPTEQQGELT